MCATVQAYIYIYIYIFFCFILYICTYIHTYIYIERERERRAFAVALPLAPTTPSRLLLFQDFVLELVSGLYLTTQTDSKDALSNITAPESSTVRLAYKDNYCTTSTVMKSAGCGLGQPIT